MRERIMRFRPAFDKRSSNPKKNYGIHGAELAFYLKGEEGAIQFVIYTNWHLPHVQKELDNKLHDHILCHPMPADLGYHSKIPRYDGQKALTEDCEWTGGKCYYDGSGLNADRIYKILVEQGDEAVWKELEKEYTIRLIEETPEQVNKEEK